MSNPENPSMTACIPHPENIPRGSGTGLMHVSVFILLALAGNPVGAQQNAQAIQQQASQQPNQQAGQLFNDAQSQVAQPPRNAFGENLVPRNKASASRKHQVYAPIQKPDDQTEIPEIEMFVGESRVFPAPGVARIAVGNGQIMTAAALDGKEIILFANGIGTSSLFVWNEDGRYQRVKVNIVPGDTTRVAREVASFLTTIPHAKASIVGDKVIVEGDALSDADLAKIEQLAKRYPQIVNFTNRLGWEPMVMLDVKVVEFPVQELRELGLKWSTTGGAAAAGIWRPFRRGSDGPYQLNIQTGQGNTPPITSAGASVEGVQAPSSLNILSAVNMGLNAQLNLLAQDGKAVVLSEPQLAARSGSKASFLAGGEFPYSVASRDGITVQFKKYGVKLDIEPKVDRTGAVRATVEAEVSKIDPSVSTESGPALLTRSTRTEFNLRSGETMVLSGLIQRDNSTNIDKVPLLGDIPVIGALFRSKRFQNQETELVVFVTPRIVDHASPGQADRIEKVHERLEQQLGSQPYLSQPLQPGRDPSNPLPLPRQEVIPEPNTSRPQVQPEQEAAITPAPTPTPTSASASASTSADPPTPVAAHPPQALVDPSAYTAPLHAASGREAPVPPQVPEARLGSPLQVRTDKVVVRAAPDPRSALLLELERGAVVRLGDKSAADDASEWRHIVIGDLQGWVPARAVGLLSK